MNTDRIKQIQQETAYPESLSVLKALLKVWNETEQEQLRQPLVSGSCSCGIPYVETKKSDIPYDTDDNVYYTDILIHHCPKCGNIDRIDEY